MGYRMQGYTIVGVSNFLSIPGCIVWLDPTKAITTVEATIEGQPAEQVITLGSLSDDGFTYTTQDFGNYRRPVVVDNYITNFSDTGNLTGVLSKVKNERFKFLQDGSPNGVYFISSNSIANTNSGISPIATCSSLTLSSTAIRGIRFITEADANVRRRVYKQIFDGSTAIYNSRTFNAIQTPTNDFAICSYGFLNTGNGNSLNEKLYGNNTLLNQHTNTIYLNESPVYNNPILLMGARYTGGNLIIRNYLTLVYDWTGYSESEVINFDLRVRTLLEEFRTGL